MRRIFSLSAILCCIIFMSCNNSKDDKATTVTESKTSETTAGQAAVQDSTSQPNVVQVAISSKDHTTLVKAVQAADLVNALSNAGPFTVFAPTNAAFDKLPAGTVENLLTPEKKEDLRDILQYHVSLGVFKAENLTDGQVIGQVNGGNITITKKDGKLMVNGANIVASIPASNGIVHVIDAVLLPK